MALTQVALIELIQQMPPTDREVEALQAAQTPSPDQPTSSRRQPSASRDPASKFTGPDPAAAERICEQILAAGRDSIIELIRLIRDPGDPGFIDYKAESVDLLRRLAGDEDLEVRLAAAWGLAKAADAGSIDRLLKMTDGSVGFERVKATQACLLLAENLAARGLPRDAARIYTHLRDTRTEKAERYLQELAEKALRGLVV